MKTDPSCGEAARELHILVVDDEPAHVEAICRSLREGKPQASLRTAGSLAEYHEAVERQVPDVAIVDLNLPDGQATVILESPRTPPPFPIMVMTSYGNEKSAVEAMKAGALDYIVKSPESFAALPGTLDRLMREWRLVQDRNEAEEALREKEEKYRVLVENAGEAIFVIQGDRIQFANPKALEMAHLTEETLHLRSFLEFVHPDDRAMILERHQQRLRGESLPSSYSFRLQTSAREIRWVDLNVVLIHWEGKPATLNFMSDVTERIQAEEERKNLQEQLLHSQKMEAVGRLAGGVAHDFNNMLGVIIGHSEMALTRLRPTEPLYADLQEILRAASRSADLTQQLLAFARKQTVQRKVLDLNDKVSGMLRMLRRLIGEDIDLIWTPGPNLWPVFMDPSQVDQILANLTVNARDAISGVGSVKISTRNAFLDTREGGKGFHPGEGSWVLLVVSDTGAGMDNALLDHIFEPFFTTKEVGKGTGLGLATVYGIVNQNNGFIRVQSRPGQGSEFSIYLPRFHAEVEVAEEEKGEGTISGGTETLLLVEDEEAILNICQSMLEDQGYNVLPCRSPSEALSLARHHRGDIHLLITDVIMPEMNGQELAGRVRSLRPDIRSLYISGYTNDQFTHLSAVQSGINFLQKPFTMKTLAAKVRELLQAP